MKTTKAHFKVFKEECQKWIVKWGLIGWCIDFYHEDWSESYSKGKAWCKWQLKGRVASLCLNPDWGNGTFSVKLLRQVAFHEVGHLLLARLHTIAGDRYIDEVEIDEEAHSLIRKLENVVFK